MTIDEAIKHCEEVAEKNESEANFGFGNACIDRSSCLECAKEHRQLAAWLRELKQLKEQMSSSEEPNKWIPISERPPEDKTYVLTTIKVPNRIAHARSGWYEDGFFYNDNGDIWKATDMEVIAWMPLPKPYKGGEEE